MLPLQLPQPFGHPDDALGVLPGSRRWNGRQHGRGETFGADLLQCVGIGEDAGVGLEVRRLAVDEGSRQVFAQGKAQGGDDALARIDRDVGEARLRTLGVALNDDGDGRQVLNGPLDAFLERRRQRHGQAIVRALEQLGPDAHGTVAGAVNDRQGPDARADGQESVGPGIAMA